MAAARGEPPARRRRLILAVGCLGMLVVAVVGQVLPAMLGRIADEFQQDLVQSGVLLMLAPVGYILSTLISGYYSDRWGERGFILLGIGLLIVGEALALHAGVFAILQAGLLIIGISQGFLESPLSSLTAEAFPERRAEMLNVTQIFFNFGAVAGPAAVGGLFALGLNWRVGFAGALVLTLLFLGLSIKGMPPAQPRRAQAGAADAPERIRWGLAAALALALLLYVAAETTMASWSSYYLIRVFDTPDSRAALAVAGFWLGMMAGRALYVLLVRRWGCLAPLIGSAAGAGVAAGAAALAPSALVAGLLCALTGFLFGGTWPTILAYAGRLNPRRMGTVFGIIISAGAAGAVIGPPLAGWAAKSTAYDLRAAMLVAAAAALAEGGILAGVWLHERQRATT